MKAVSVLLSSNCDFILAVGGGSVVDAAKYIAVAARWGARTSDPFDIVMKWGLARDKDFEPRAAVPVGVVMTLPASGSEMNHGAVISRRATRQKQDFDHPLCYPVFSVVDPEITYSLPQRQIAYGLCDSFVHVLEHYAGHHAMGLVQDETSEAIMRALVRVAPGALECEKPSYQARADFFWATTQALNGLIGVGVRQCWAAHAIGHNLTALYGLDHAATLACVVPPLLRMLKEERREKLARIAERVFDVRNAVDMAEEGIRQIENFFVSIGMKTHLSQHCVGPEHFEELASKFECRLIGAEGTIGPAEILSVLKAAL